MHHEWHDPSRHCTACGTRAGDVVIWPADPVTERAYRVWSVGSDDRIAAAFRVEAEAFVGRRNLGPGLRVLDAACGSGNATLPAARTGAVVTGLDLVGSSLDAASARAAREGLRVMLEQGNVELLPFPDGEFDVVLSMFGVMFAARPDRVLAELSRVTRSTGQVALASWTPGAFFGELFAIHAALVPPPPDLPDPLHWGDPDVVGEWFDDREWDVNTKVRTLRVRYPYTPGGTGELYRVAYGPTVRAFEALDEDGRAVLAADIAAHWARHRHSSAAGTEVEAEFLELVAIRR